MGAFVVLARWAWQWQRLATVARQIAADRRRRRCTARCGAWNGKPALRTPTCIVASSQSIEPGVIGMLPPVLIWPRHLTGCSSNTQIEAIRRARGESYRPARQPARLAADACHGGVLVSPAGVVDWRAARRRARACVRRACAGARCGSSHLRRKHPGDMPAVSGITHRQRVGRDRRQLENTHRSHHEKCPRGSAWDEKEDRAGARGVSSSRSRQSARAAKPQRARRTPIAKCTNRAVGSSRPR